MEIAKFIRMDEGTVEDYEIVGRAAREHEAEHLVNNIIANLKQLQGPMLGYQIDRFEHSLQTATRAERDGADEEMIVCALLHDIGDVVAPKNHSQMAASVLRPYVSEKNYWIVLHHGLFQGYYYYDKIGLDPNVRDRLRGHEYFEACEYFCEHWDQMSFDPDYKSYPLEHFVPMIKKVFTQNPNTFD
ncbi:MAG: HD domain-containing protein [Pseudomonadota bacterium]